MTAMELNAQGMPVDAVLSELSAKRHRDVAWRDGKVFAMVFDGGPSVHEVAERAAAMFLHENALNTHAFPSLGEIQSEVVGWTSALLHGGDTAAGFMTSGGTESILCAVLAARTRAEAERGITAPEMVLPISAHAAFHKAAEMFKIEVRIAPVLDDFTADVDAMAALITPNTVLVVGSAPQYPQGVIDPIPEIAALAAAVGASCHVDACMGGFVLPFAEMNGANVPPWDFRVPGVTTISADIHKLGYAPKGASVILHRTKELRRYQTFTFDGWLGGMYATPNMQGSRSGVPMAAAWAVMQHLGTDGYRALTAATLEAADRMRAGIRGIDGLMVLGDSKFHLLSMAADPAADQPLEMFTLGDALARRGWFHGRQYPPNSLHATVSAGTAAMMDQYLVDLNAAVNEVRGSTTSGTAGAYATLE
jgi:sphinganine-1-phosphate aldolase